VEWGPSYNVAPQTFQPVVRLNRDTGQREIVLMRWGLIPYWSKDSKIGYSTINAKAETVATAPAFREAVRRRRCLVPADAFYEWQKLDAKHKQPFAIALASREPYGLAGLWERWRDPATGQKTSEWLETFTIITTDANQVVAPLHHRMPVIIERKDYARWLGGDPAQPALDLLRPFPAEKMTAWKVDKSVGNVRNDAAHLLETPAEKPSDEPPEQPRLGFVADPQQ
jgi:putative SOS response-associated peptidase YedK